MSTIDYVNAKHHHLSMANNTTTESDLPTYERVTDIGSPVVRAAIERTDDGELYAVLINVNGKEVALHEECWTSGQEDDALEGAKSLLEQLDTAVACGYAEAGDARDGEDGGEWYRVGVTWVEVEEAHTWIKGSGQ